MALTVLVTGLLEHDSGKTWVGLSLAACLSTHGVKVSAYKPVGGFNAWYGFSVLKRSMEVYRVLAGGDALSYAELLGQSLEEVNPVALLTGFPDPTRLHGPASYLSAVSSLERTVIAARLSLGGRTEHYLVSSNLDLLPLSLRNEISKMFSGIDYEDVDAASLLNRLGSGSVAEALDSILQRLSKHSEVVVVESFNDAVVPYEGSTVKSPDFLVVVAPGKVLVYSGSRLRIALEVAGYGGRRVPGILGLLGKPLLVDDLPPAEDREKFAEKVCGTRLASLLL